MRLALAVACVAAAVSSADAQTDPIRCWWRTTTGAVAIGETFDARLTCAVREQATTRTVADESRLAAAVIQLAPFELLGGSHPADLRSPSHRFFQYQYSIRIIDRDVVGRDTKFPDLQIPYRVHTLTDGEWMPGRERTYVIPGHAIRILSLVPIEASDIRDSSDAGFAVIETLRFRARAFDVAGYALVVLGLIVAMPALMALARRRRAGVPDQPVISRRDVARAVDEELSAIGRETAHGWSPGLAARALSVLRLAGAAALGRDVAWRALDPAVPRTGLVVSRGILRKQQVEVSSAITSSDLVSRTKAQTASAERASAVDALARSLQVFTAALYGASFHPDDLDEAFLSARQATERLRKR